MSSRAARVPVLPPRRLPAKIGRSDFRRSSVRIDGSNMSPATTRSEIAAWSARCVAHPPPMESPPNHRGPDSVSLTPAHGTSPRVEHRCCHLRTASALPHWFRMDSSAFRLATRDDPKAITHRSTSADKLTPRVVPKDGSWRHHTACVSTRRNPMETHHSRTAGCRSCCHPRQPANGRSRVAVRRTIQGWRPESPRPNMPITIDES
jgi:hypothetical protein